LANDSVVVFDAATGARRGGFSFEPPANTIYTLAIAPDNRWLTFVGVKASVTYLGMCRIDGSQGGRLVVGGAYVREFSVSPDGRHLAYTKAPPQQKLWAMMRNGAASRPSVSRLVS
jgi:hypothetical protein